MSFEATSEARPGRPRVTPWVSVLLLILAAATQATPGSYVGLSLSAALTELQSQGLDIFFSSALVRPEMIVETEPRGSSPREVLTALLEPHGLAVHEGPDGSLLVVPRARTPRSTAVRGIRGKVLDRDTGTAVEGVDILLSGDLRGETGTDGSFELTGLAAGSYNLEARRYGFVSQRLDGVRVTSGMTEIVVELLPLPTTLDEIVVVPELEVGSIHRGTTLRRTELERIPTPRDPWAVVTQTPGILTDRVNVGGSESGAQAMFLAPGSSREENLFSLDGVNTTDMAATGASTIYYDFDQFEEMRISSGGSDVRTATAGVTIQMVTKRGSDTPRGSARYLITDSDGFFGFFEQGSSDITGKLAPGQADVRGNEINRILDYGAEVGGPLVHDRLWVWGSYGFNDIDLTTVGRASGESGDPDDTLLENAAAKVNAQLSTSTSAVLSYHRGDKRKENRGAGPSRSLETTWRQRGPADVYKLEGTRIWGSRLFLNGQVDIVDGGFSLISRAAGEALLDADGVWKNGFLSGSTDRDSDNIELAGSAYFEAGALFHTLDFGGAVREYRFSDDFGWTGARQAYNVTCENIGLCDTGDLVAFERQGNTRVDLDYGALWAQDGFAAGRWTLKLGLRADFQDGRNLPGSVEANPAIPDVLPGVEFTGNDAGFDWRTVSPRLAASYAVEADGKILLRLSYGRFAEQLGLSDVARLNPLGSAEAFYTFQDANGDNFWQPDEPFELIGTEGFDPASPLVSSNRTAPGLDPEVTDELLVGLERAFLPAWVIGLNLTWRRISDVPEERRLVTDGSATRAASAADFVFASTLPVVLPDGRLVSPEFYELDASLQQTGGTLLVNGGRQREYLGLTLSFNRRLTGRWTMRGYLNFGEADWHVPASYFFANDPTDLAGAGDNDGDLFAAPSAGSRSDVFLQSTWTAQLAGFYQVAPNRPWGFTVAANAFAREGYPIPYLARYLSATDGIRREGQLTSSIDDFRTDDVFLADFSLEKEWRLGDRLAATLSLASFNLLNESFVLQRERNLTGARPDHLEETLAPRVFRLGVRLHW